MAASNGNVGLTAVKDGNAVLHYCPNGDPGLLVFDFAESEDEQKPRKRGQDAHADGVLGMTRPGVARREFNGRDQPLDAVHEARAIASPGTAKTSYFVFPLLDIARRRSALGLRSRLFRR